MLLSVMVGESQQWELSNWSHCIHSQRAEGSEYLHSTHFLLFLQSGISGQGMGPFAVSRYFPSGNPIKVIYQACPVACLLGDSRSH